MKRLTSLLLTFTLLLSALSPAFAAEGAGQEEPVPAKLVIDQVYGGGGKGETPISNSFVELYNPNDQAVELNGYALACGDNALDLTGTIPAQGSYLVVGAAEETSDEFLTYDLPEADQTCDWVINNKSYTIRLTNGESEIDSVTAGSGDATKVSKQKSLARIDHADTDTDADFQIIVWEKESVTVDEAYVAAYAPRNSKGDMGQVHGASSEPTYTPVTTGDVRVTGYFDESGALKLELAGRYNSGAMNADGGSLEIVQYNAANGYAYAVSGVKGKLIAVDLNGSLAGETVVTLTGTEYNLKSMVSVNGFTYGDMTSVAISPDGTMLAVAIQAQDYAAQGMAALFRCNGDGSLELLSTVTVGVQPDMVTFADNNTILTADEGEPRGGKDAADPKGSVSIVTIGGDNSLTASIVTFDSFDPQRDALTAAGVLIQKGSNPSTDFEPEYIAVSGDTAYVSLQEANAIAVLDIPSAVFTGVYPLGFQDYSVTKVDLQKNDSIGLANYENVCGIKMPDGIAAAELGGKTYLLTANEGDSRADWEGLDNEYESKTSPTGNVTLDSKVVWFNATLWDGLDESKAYVFGGRSFSIYEVTDQGLTPVYDSGSDFEEITAQVLPDYFNASNDKISLDNRSGKKGPEPETVITGTVEGRTYAFIALERIGGVMVYDITDPAEARFVNYINSREFDAAIQGDVSPEGLCFIPASDSKSGTPLLLAACEVSGTLAAYELTAAGAEPEPEPSPDPEPELEGLKIAVISDDHLYDTEVLGCTGDAFEQYLASDRKLLVESEAILDAALEKIADSGVEYLLIPGDLTKDGEKVNHELLAEKLAQLEADTGIEVFVINGNHDISNANAVKFTEEGTEAVETVNTDDFREIYKEFGYDQAVAQDTNSLSYAVDLGADYRLIVMDACIYNNDKANPSQETGGAFTNETLNWVLEQIKAAVQEGRRPIGMMHHGLVPHTAIQPTMFSEYLVEDYETVAATLADAGMNVVFTGHFHSQDVSSFTTENGSVLYDVETGSLVTSPCPIRYVTLGADSFSYTTDHVTQVSGYENFQEHAASFLRTGMEGLVDAMLPDALRALGVTDEAQITALCQNEALKALLVNGFIAHYAGDETMDEATAAGLAELAGINPTLAQVAGSLYMDYEPADCAVSALPLSDLPTYPSEPFRYQDLPEKTGDNSWYFDSVYAVREQGLMVGDETGCFHPGSHLTRAEAATVVVALAGVEVDMSVTATPFQDVSGWAAPYIAAAAENGFVAGKGDGIFDPEADVTREEFVTMLEAVLGIKADDYAGGECPFTDVPAGSWAVNYIVAAHKNGLSDGYPDGTFGFGAPITRAEAAVMLNAIPQN